MLEGWMVAGYILAFVIIALCIFSMAYSPEKRIFSKEKRHEEIKSFRKNGKSG
ncbi:MAG: hypothetical protein P4N59_06760 [Negativicutes bacterium]|nr:hypothetical protein [Negativicutes bacterium]